MKQLIAEGAEAKIYKNGSLIIKERIPKKYRIKELDNKIRRYRTRREISILQKTSQLINTPKLKQGSSESNFIIVMDFIKGKKLADCLDKLNEKERTEICKKIGKQIAVLHNNNIIHGDLTTSNMILNKNEIYFIDFGLSFIDQKPEHKAVDLHLIKQALESKHYKNFESSFKNIIESYKENSKNYKEILDRLIKVESRGRYKLK